MKLLKTLALSTMTASLVACSGGGGGGAAPAAGTATDAKKADTKKADAKADTKKAAPKAAAAPAAAAPAAAGPKGAIKGKVAFAGAAPAPKKLDRASDPFCAKTEAVDQAVVVNANKTLANVWVKVMGAPDGEAPKDPIDIIQKDCIYEPRVLGVVAGQKVAIKNGDQTLHNVHTYRGADTIDNLAQPPGSPAIKKKMKAAKPGQPQEIRFSCDVHPWMTAYVGVHNNALHAVTGKDGAFEIKDVPVGKYTVEAWHEVYGVKKVEVEVKADAPAAAEFSYDGTENKG